MEINKWKGNPQHGDTALTGICLPHSNLETRGRFFSAVAEWGYRSCCALTMQAHDWRDSSAVRNINCCCKQPWIWVSAPQSEGSHPPITTAPGHPMIFLDSDGTWTHTCTDCTHRHMCTILKIKKGSILSLLSIPLGMTCYFDILLKSVSLPWRLCLDKSFKLLIIFAR